MLAALSRGDYAIFLGVMTDGFGPAIRRRREELRLNQTELARAADVNRAHLSEVERGKIKLPSADFRRRVAKALGMTHVELLIAAGELSIEEVPQASVQRPPSSQESRLYALLDDMDDEDLIGLLKFAEYLVNAHRTGFVNGGKPGAEGGDDLGDKVIDGGRVDRRQPQDFAVHHR